jgi:hypothetical protein
MQMSSNEPSESVRFDPRDILKYMDYLARPAPRKHERLGVTTPNQWKRAALLFDRIWTPGWIWTERLSDIGAGTVMAQFHAPEIPHDLTFGDLALDKKITGTSSLAAYSRQDGALELTGDSSQQYQIYDHSSRLVAASYNSAGIFVTPLYASERVMRGEIREGPAIAYEAALENIPIIDEAAVTWEEIIEFRKDKRASRKVRRLGLWLTDSLKCESVAHASDTIAARIDDYAWALKKHGLKTVTGAVSYLSASGGAALVVDMLNRPVWESITCGLTCAGVTCAWVADRLIEREDAIRGANSEVAILYDAQKRFGEQKTLTK